MWLLAWRRLTLPHLPPELNQSLQVSQQGSGAARMQNDSPTPTQPNLFLLHSGTLHRLWWARLNKQSMGAQHQAWQKWEHAPSSVTSGARAQREDEGWMVQICQSWQASMCGPSVCGWQRTRVCLESPSCIYPQKTNPGQMKEVWNTTLPLLSPGSDFPSNMWGGAAGWLGMKHSPCLSHARLPYGKRKWRFGWEKQFVTTVPSILSSVQHPSCYFQNLASPWPLAPKLML